MYDPTLSKEIQAFAIYLERTRTIPLPNNYDLVLDVIIEKEPEEIIWAYYYVDHESKTLFWQEPYDCGESLLSEVRGVKEASQVSAYFQFAYYYCLCQWYDLSQSFDLSLSIGEILTLFSC